MATMKIYRAVVSHADVRNDGEGRSSLASNSFLFLPCATRDQYGGSKYGNVSGQRGT